MVAKTVLVQTSLARPNAVIEIGLRSRRPTLPGSTGGKVNQNRLESPAQSIFAMRGYMRWHGFGTQRVAGTHKLSLCHRANSSPRVGIAQRSGDALSAPRRGLTGVIGPRESQCGDIPDAAAEVPIEGRSMWRKNTRKRKTPAFGFIGGHSRLSRSTRVV